MRYLLDTHIFLWWLKGDKRLGRKTKEIIRNSHNEIFISVVSTWEMSIKQKVGKLSLKASVGEYFEQSGFLILDVVLDHILALEKLPFHHQDPFDRLLVAQARAENLVFVTDDRKIKQYDLKIA